MSHLELKVADLLTQDTAVKAIVAGRVFPMFLPKNTRLPAVSLTRIDCEHDRDLEGNSGMENPTIQIDCWATGYEQAKDLGRAVRAAMNAATDAVNGFTATAISDADVRDDAANYFAVSIDFSCWRQED